MKTYAVGTHKKHLGVVLVMSAPQCIMCRNKENINTLRLKTVSIGPDKSGYQVNNFLISPRKYMLWVLIRRASARHF